jgi:hypothetical protein
MTPVRTVALSPFLLLAPLLAQAPPPDTSAKDAALPTAGAKDPYTGGAAKAMQAAGVLAYGPFVWANDQRTEDVERVLGENRIRWIETEHFLIGCTLGTATAPEDAEARKLTNAELARMRKRHPRFPDRASRIDPWLRLHLYAYRAEQLYGEFATLIAHAEDGTHLGQKGKFPILLFQKKSDVARYLDRFCGIKSEMSQRCSYPATRQQGLVLGAEGEDPYDEATVHAHFRFHLIQLFCDASGGAPYWLSLGLAHWYERQVPCNVMMAAIKDEESVDQDTQNKWGAKMKKRAQHEELLIPFHELATKTDFGYWAHLQAWSRVDHLLATDRAKLGAFLVAVRQGGAARQVEQLELVFGMTPEDFDAKWREAVLKGPK